MRWHLSSRSAFMLSEKVCADAREGDIGMQLGEIAKANPGVAIGSYPFFDSLHGANTNAVLRARDTQKLAQAKRASRTCWSECGEHNQIAETRPLECPRERQSNQLLVPSRPVAPLSFSNFSPNE